MYSKASYFFNIHNTKQNMGTDEYSIAFMIYVSKKVSE